MKQIPTLIAAAVAAVLATPAVAASLAKFDGGIGVQLVAGISATPPGVAGNTVRGVPPGGKPWVIARLKADVKDDGRIVARGEGLVFAAGETIGTARPVVQVKATLFCGADGFSSPAVPIDATGNFSIDALLSDTAGATPASPCDSPVLLIRSAVGSGNWFAAGIPTD